MVNKNYRYPQDHVLRWKRPTVGILLLNREMRASSMSQKRKDLKLGEKGWSQAQKSLSRFRCLDFNTYLKRRGHFININGVRKLLWEGRESSAFKGCTANCTSVWNSRKRLFLFAATSLLISISIYHSI